MILRSAAWCVCLSLLASLALAKETVCLKNGFCLEADSHTVEQDRLVCHVAGGILEFPNDMVANIRTVSTIPADASNNIRAPQSQPAPSELVTQAAIGQGVDAAFVRSVAKIESGFRPEAVSPKGALGLMQLMPATAADLGVDPGVAAGNAEGGAKYLRSLLLKYKGDSVLALAAYNAGPGAVAKFGGVPPYEETRRYILKVLKEYEREHKADSASGTSSQGSESRSVAATR